MVAASKAALYERVIARGVDNLKPDAARALLRMRFTEGELNRIQALMALGRAGWLTDEQSAELEGYLQLGSLLTMIHATVRRALKRRVGA